jgi:hypothetical protein
MPRLKQRNKSCPFDWHLIETCGQQSKATCERRPIIRIDTPRCGFEVPLVGQCWAVKCVLFLLSQSFLICESPCNESVPESSQNDDNKRQFKRLFHAMLEFAALHKIIRLSRNQNQANDFPWRIRLTRFRLSASKYRMFNEMYSLLAITSRTCYVCLWTRCADCRFFTETNGDDLLVGTSTDT